MRIAIDPTTPEGYQTFIRCKQLPAYRVEGREVVTDQMSYESVFGKPDKSDLICSSARLFDYQQAVCNTALQKRRYAAFLDCGLGKTAIFLHWADQVAVTGKVLILCPLSVIAEVTSEAVKFNISAPVHNLREGYDTWTSGIGVLNYEQCRDIPMRGVKGVILDESSILKNGDGKTKKWLTALVANVPYRLACSATPAPNEQSEYASHAVFLGISRTNKEFYSRFFRKQGNDWLLKAHATKAFYRSLASWSCYIHDPRKAGYEAGGYLDEEPEYILRRCAPVVETGNNTLFHASLGLSQAREIFRARANPDTGRFRFVVETAISYRSVVWCKYNDEEAAFAAAIPNSAVVTGKTPIEQRVGIIDRWRSGEINTIISKPSILGWGVNMQQAEAHVYSGYDFSFESFYQAIRRSHRYGRKGRLKVFIPVTPSEQGIFATIERKLSRFRHDVAELQNMYS